VGITAKISDDGCGGVLRAGDGGSQFPIFPHWESFGIVREHLNANVIGAKCATGAKNCALCDDKGVKIV
jgi:hypothetical protein